MPERTASPEPRLQDAGTPLPAALGRALLGQRIVCPLTPRQLETGLPTLRRAMALRLPLVVPVVADRGPFEPGTPSRDAVLFALADEGLTVVFAPSLSAGRHRARELAESALLPVILAAGSADGGENGSPEPEPGERIDVPGPSQKLVFGDRRRRVPVRLETDRPATLGSALDGELLEATRVSRRLWSEREVQERWRAGGESVLTARGPAASKVRLVTTADRIDGVAKALEGADVRVLGLRAAGSWIDDELREALSGARRILVVEGSEGPEGGLGPLGRRVERLLEATSDGWLPGRHRHPALRTAVLGAGDPAAEEVREWVETSEDRPPITWLGLEPGAAGASPRRWALADQLQRELPDLPRQGLRRRPADEGDAAPASSVPRAARRLGLADGPPYLDLAAFRERLELPSPAPEPVLTAGTLPGAAGLLARPQRVGPPPIWTADDCDATGACWSACPDDAFTPWIGGTRELLEILAGPDLSTLRPSLSRWANALDAPGEDPSPSASERLRAAWEVIEESLPESRRSSAGAAAERLVDRSEGLPWTAPTKLGSSLLTLPIDPERCTGCGLCVAECPTGALAVRDPSEPGPPPPDADVVDALPSPGPEEISALVREQGLDPLAAALLSRRARETLVGPGTGGPGDGLRTGLRQVLGLLRVRDDVEREQLQGSLRDLREAVVAEIHGHLESSLPDDDLDRLAAGLEGLTRADLDLADLAGRVERGVDSRRIDAARLRRQVALGRRLADLEHRLGAEHHPALIVTSVPELAASSGALLLAPVVATRPSEALGVARGLAEAVAAEAATDRELVAEAEALVGRRGADSLVGRLDLANPRVTVVLGETDVPAALATGLFDVFAGRLAVTVLVVGDPAVAREGTPDLAALTLATGGCAFVQVSPGDAADLVRSVDALRDAGAGVLRLHAPRPARDGFATDGALERARAAIGTRVFPLLRFLPGRSIGRPGLHVGANPAPEADWADRGTPIEWAVGEERFGDLLVPAEGPGPTPREILDRLANAESAADVGAPVVGDGDGGHLRARPALIQWAAERLAAWRFLRAFASPEPAPVVRPETEDGADRVEAPSAEEIERRVVDRLRRRLRVLAGGGAG